MSNVNERRPAASESGSRATEWILIFILVVMALVALYANVQKLRRAKIEKVTVTLLAGPTPAATPAPPNKQ